jgi:predicted dehydrogenase
VSKEAHALQATVASEIAAPELAYLPPMPQRRDHPIALIGAGRISSSHLDAYRKAGFNVKVIASRTLAHAISRRDQFFPQAEVSDDILGTIARDDVEVVDLTPHPEVRAPLIEAAVKAGKHVLSQKPFVLDLALGRRLADLADKQRVVLAVNQNGRWAPHLSFMREAVRHGLVGGLQSLHVTIAWDHSWIAGTPFDEIDDLILYDFAIHWLDFLASLIGPTATSVHATRVRAAEQRARPALLAQVLVEFPHGQAALLFDGNTRQGQRDRTIITGSDGTLESHGPDLGTQELTWWSSAGFARPRLEGTWFNDGFAGTMGALLQAIETGTPPLHDARDNLTSLALAFAAIASSRRGTPVEPASVTSLAAATS